VFDLLLHNKTGQLECYQLFILTEDKYGTTKIHEITPINNQFEHDIRNYDLCSPDVETHSNFSTFLFLYTAA
jgi:hypothetical protein